MHKHCIRMQKIIHLQNAAQFFFITTLTPIDTTSNDTNNAIFYNYDQIGSNNNYTGATITIKQLQLPFKRVFDIMCCQLRPNPMRNKSPFPYFLADPLHHFPNMHCPHKDL